MFAYARLCVYVCVFIVCASVCGWMRLCVITNTYLYVLIRDTYNEPADTGYAKPGIINSGSMQIREGNFVLYLLFV